MEWGNLPMEISFAGNALYMAYGQSEIFSFTPTLSFSDLVSSSNELLSTQFPRL